MTWVDHLIFSMVPLGIATVIAGAIRVSGPQIAKAFIGRARENRALAEIELMSSISGEVCEMFDGNSIVRAMGKPKIAHFLLFSDLDKMIEHTGEDSKLARRGGDQTENILKQATTEKQAISGADEKGLSGPKQSTEDSCGIHTIKSACIGGLIEPVGE